MTEPKEGDLPGWPYKDCFPFRSEERYIKDELLGFIDKVILDRPLLPLELKNLAILKHALSLFPITPNGIYIGLGIVLRDGDETSYCDVFVSEERFSISKGGYASGPFGGDSYSSTIFACEAGGFRDGSLDPWTVGEWELEARELLNLGATMTFENETEETAIDWAWDEFDERVRRWVESGGNL
jgi:hypothetical protein